MKQKIRTILVLLLLLAGVAVMVYPPLSSWLNARHSSYAIQSLLDQLANADPETLTAQHRLAQQYNLSLTGGEPPEVPYEQILDFGNGVIGAIRIPKLGVELQIYHGTSETVLQKGAGHMPSSAFPIGGPGNHAVLTGHTGLPGAELFTDLTELTAGDVFHIDILGETLTYEVDQILTVLPHETEALAPVRGRDYCTLVTCTPYGINSHRLLVRGERTEEEHP